MQSEKILNKHIETNSFFVFGFLRTFIFIATILFSGIPSAYSSEETLIRDILWKEFLSLKESRPKIALVLGGGGARGFSHIGVIKVLEENKIPVDIIVGTSAGALIGGLYASGMQVPELEKIGRDIGWNKISNVSSMKIIRMFTNESLFSTNKLETYLKFHIGEKRFDQTKIPFACISCDIKTGERIVFKEGELAFAMRASATIPGVFEPVEYRHRFLIDGGIVDNLPVDIAKVMGADFILAVYPKVDSSQFEASSVLKTLVQAINIQGESLTSRQLINADFALIPNVGDVSIIELHRFNECIEAGTVTARKSVDNIKDKILENFIKLIAKTDGKN